MGIYYFNILSLPIYKFLIKNKKMLCIVISMQMFLILALRNEILGVDYLTYSAGFKYIKGLSFSELLSSCRVIRTAKLVWPFSFESGYVVLNWIVGKIGLEFYGLQVVCAAINMISFGRFIYKYSENPILSFAMFIALGMYRNCFGILRQSLAVSIVLWAVPFILEKKNVKAYAVILLGFLFHRTAILFLPLVWLVNIKVSKKLFRYCFCLWGVLLAIGIPVYNFFVANILKIFGYYGYETEKMEYNNLILLMFIISIIIYFAISFTNFKDQVINSACVIYLLGVFLEIFGMCNEVFARSVEYYFLFIIILIPNLLSKYRVWNTKVVVGAIIYALMVLYMYMDLEGSILVPYRMYEFANINLYF